MTYLPGSLTVSRAQALACKYLSRLKDYQLEVLNGSSSDSSPLERETPERGILSKLSRCLTKATYVVGPEAQTLSQLSTD